MLLLVTLIVFMCISMVQTQSIAATTTVSSTCSNFGRYGYTCDSDSYCNSNLGLICVDQICDCRVTHYWDVTICVAYGTLNLNCSESALCSPVLRLLCSNSTCTCAATDYWNSTSCVPKKSNGISCSLTIECQENNLLQCMSGTCRCNNTLYWNSTRCGSYSRYTQQCSQSLECNDAAGLSCPTTTGISNCPTSATAIWCNCAAGQFYNTTSRVCQTLKTVGLSCSMACHCNTAVGLSCISNTCACAATHYWNSSSCVPKLTNGLSCSTTVQCQDYNLLQCTSGTCRCTTTQYWNSTRCVNKKSYTQQCSQSLECNAAAGLSCPATTGISNCPTPATSIWCNCAAGQFYNTTSLACQTIKTFGTSCSMNCHCNTIAGLSCQSKICRCPSTSRWFWNTRSLKCVECPADWTLISDRCYYAFANKLDWNDALAACQSVGSTLMTVQTQDEFDLLKQFYQTYGGGNIWIGARSLTLFDFRWAFDNTPFSQTSSFWCSGEPNNWGGSSSAVTEGCVFLWSTSSTLCFNDFPCSSSELFCCEKTD